jgi:hypothetical protein
MAETPTSSWLAAPWRRAVGPLVAVALLLAPTAAAAATPKLTLSATTAAPGASVTVRGAGLPHRTRLRLQVDGSATGMPYVTTSSTGTFSVRMTVPKVASGTPGSRSRPRWRRSC